ncbi:MAG: hypothetical protein GY756_19160 [bacterium]|nr:hypothetical protein [bacterium]
MEDRRSKIALVPIYKSWNRNSIFNLEASRDFILEPMFVLKKLFEVKGYSLQTVDLNTIRGSDYFILYRLDLVLIFKLLVCNKLMNTIYIQLEPPVIMKIHSEGNIKKLAPLFKKILTWNDNLINQKNFVKFLPPMPYRRSSSKVTFSERKLLTNISGYKLSAFDNELYSERIRAIKFFENRIPNDFDLFGMGWSVADFPSYKGCVNSKLETLKNYKFSICYENISGMNGLLSEKIFDCFYANTIPIFWGAENVTDYIPKNCFIDKREYSNYETLLEYLESMEEKEYNDYISAIDTYLKSEKYKLFLPENYFNIIFESLMNKPEASFGQLKVIKSFGFLSKFKFFELGKKMIKKIKK